MSKDSTIAGNKIIAEFDGYKEVDGKFWRNKAWTGIEGLKYHSDWNRLMPVVEKIAEYGKWELQPGFATLTLYPELGIGNKKSIHDKKRFSTSEMDWEREDGEPVGWAFLTFSVVVQFITWYNKKQPLSWTR